MNGDLRCSARGPPYREEKKHQVVLNTCAGRPAAEPVGEPGPWENGTCLTRVGGCPAPVTAPRSAAEMLFGGFQGGPQAKDNTWVPLLQDSHPPYR